MISIEQLRSFVGSGAISISSSGGAQGAPAIRNTGVLHAIKTFFGFESAKAVNRATVEAVREAINNDPKLFVGRNRANELLNAVRGTITIEKVKEIIPVDSVKEDLSVQLAMKHIKDNAVIK